MNQYWVPGGRILKSEKMHDTATRKCKEEVGLECCIGPIVHTAETIFSDGPHNISTHSINSCFLAYLKSPDQKVHLDEHHESFKWVSTLNEIPGLHPYVIACMKGAGIRE
jgi:colanic acid biosynthesis protein WcaH